MVKVQKNIIKTDIVIAGGGPVGCSLAILLAKAGINVVCIDQDDPKTSIKKSFDGRTTAISFGSHFVFKDIGIWNILKINACPIQHIKILESGSPVLLQFLTEEANEEAFGWIVENRQLRQELYKSLASLKNVCHMAPAKITSYGYGQDCIYTHLENGTQVESKLVVGADGRKSFTREWMGVDTRGRDYKQSAVVAIVNHENPHHFCAIEDFRPSGPFAILPMIDAKDGKHQSSIVWTQDDSHKNSALYWDDESFIAGLNERFPPQYGKIEWGGVRFSYPLNLVHAKSYSAIRMVLIGDAAHGIHPIAGQGLNLGIRDVSLLSKLMIDAKSKSQDFGHSDITKLYEEKRVPDNVLMIGATDTLNKLFSNHSSSIRALRTSGLKMIEKWPRAKQFFMNQAMGKKIFKN